MKQHCLLYRKIQLLTKTNAFLHLYNQVLARMKTKTLFCFFKSYGFIEISEILFAIHASPSSRVNNTLLINIHARLQECLARHDNGSNYFQHLRTLHVLLSLNTGTDAARNIKQSAHLKLSKYCNSELKYLA